MHAPIVPAQWRSSLNGRKVLGFMMLFARLTASAGRRGLADGSDLLKRIREQQLDQKQAFQFERFSKAVDRGTECTTR